MKRGLIIIVAATLLICTASLSPNGSDKTLATVAPAEVNWQAQWIGSPWEGEEYDKDIIQPAPEFRKQVTIQKRIRKATANVTGLGFFEFFVNGKKVGNGFYATGRTRWVSPYGTPRFICQIEIEYQDGTTETIISDQGWQVRKSPIILNDVFDGEIYDARQESNEEWQQVAIRKSPDGKLMLQDGPADRVIETLHPQSIQKLDDGRWEVDFGDYVSGWVRLYDFTLAKGNAISIEFPIESAGNGEYKYIGNGHKTESYAPRFCWWVFEKAIISGWPGELKPENIVAEVVHSDVPVSAHFDCSTPLLKSINEIWKRAMTDNMHVGVPTDCPHREKGPYTGDGQASCVTAMHNFAAAGFYRKWLHDMTDCQDLETGYVPNGAPWHPGCGGGVPWGSAMCIIPWEHYLHYGDIGLAEEAYEAMTKTDFPSFGWWVEQGAKTTWEQWNGRDSRCHQMFGGALVWMYRRICGVRTDESAPGYKHIIVKPTPVGDLTWASYDTQTPQGTLAVRWDRDDTDFVLKITVPKGSTATVYMPDGSAPVELNPGTTRLKARLSTLSDNPQIAAVQQLARRTLGSKASGIVFSEIPSDSLDVFTIESTEDGKILISGNNASAMSCGLNHYLRYCCGVEVGVACLRKV